mmetsp:Transcript_6838/g.11540  ORF Transcript_6838/g.11540 Transcript_6838/m.11540 type:complete len:329 (-) Transcript_6838:131-1117(-)
MYIALTQCAASVYQMMRGFIVVITAFMAVIFLKKKQYLHHWVSIVIIFIAVFLVGLIGIMEGNNSEDDDAPSTSLLGVLLLVASQFMISSQLITEEIIIGKKSMNPLFIVGVEGFWGCLEYAFLLLILQNIKCSGSMCPYGVVEDTSAVFEEMGDHPELIWYSLLIIVSICLFNATGVAITKYASASQRATIDSCRTLCIWIVAIIQGTETFNIPEFLAFIVLVVGTLVYNEIIEVPIKGMFENTKRNLTKVHKSTIHYQREESEEHSMDFGPSKGFNKSPLLQDHTSVRSSPLSSVSEKRKRSELIKQHHTKNNSTRSGDPNDDIYK